MFEDINDMLVREMPFPHTQTAWQYFMSMHIVLYIFTVVVVAASLLYSGILNDWKGRIICLVVSAFYFVIMSNKIEYDYHMNLVRWDSNGVEQVRREFVAPLLKIAQDCHNNGCYVSIPGDKVTWMDGAHLVHLTGVRRDGKQTLVELTSGHETIVRNGMVFIENATPVPATHLIGNK